MSGREHGLLFTGAMVRRLLVGAKVQTRRALTARNSSATLTAGDRPVAFNFARLGLDADLREWSMLGDGFEGPPFLYARDEARALTVRLRSRVQPQDVLWVRETWASADFEREVYFRASHGAAPCPAAWRSPIHLPRRLARLLLAVHDVRLERVREISEADAVAEGCPDGRAEFFELWKSINGPASLAADPWVWVYKFKVNHAIPASLPVRSGD